MPLNSKEHRRHKRYSIDGCTLQSRQNYLLDLFSKLSTKYMVLDISKGGVHFISRQNFKKGQKISLIITAPSLKKEAIQVQGRVVRATKFPSFKTYGVGVRFTRIDTENRNRLKTLLKSVAKSKDDISSYIDISAT